MGDYEAHKGPGRRLAEGSTRGDHLLALFGFASHMVFFVCVTAIFCVCNPDLAWPLFLATLFLSALALVSRAMMVGPSTTVESLKAIQGAWLSSPDKEQ